MGQLASKAGKLVWGELDVRIIMVGLDAAGKTTILFASQTCESPAPLSRSIAEHSLSLRMIVFQPTTGVDRYKLKLGEIVTVIPTVGRLGLASPAEWLRS